MLIRQLIRGEKLISVVDLKCVSCNDLKLIHLYFQPADKIHHHNDIKNDR